MQSKATTITFFFSEKCVLYRLKKKKKSKTVNKCIKNFKRLYPLPNLALVKCLCLRFSLYSRYFLTLQVVSLMHLGIICSVLSSLPICMGLIIRLASAYPVAERTSHRLAAAVQALLLPRFFTAALVVIWSA